MQASTKYRWATHNYYLLLWYELGIVGVACLLLLFAQLVGKARAAAALASRYRALLVAAAIGAIALACAVFFVNIFAPWAYFWAYMGIMMRIAACHLDPQARAVEPARVTEAPATERVAQDSFGWAARPRR
jgi:O-antigen ligase